MKNVLLFIASIILLFLFAFWSLVVATELILRGKTSSQFYFEVALQIDILGNIMCQFIFNFILIKQNGYKFGKRGETISSVLGKNKRDNTLTCIGEGIVLFLNIFQENHCIVSITA